MSRQLPMIQHRQIMTYRYNLILLLLLIISPRASLCEGAPPQTTPAAPTLRKEQPNSYQTYLQSQPTSSPDSYADLVDVDLSTPKKSTNTFIKLFNDIMPPTTTAYLQAICAKFAIPYSHNNCLDILESRLRYLKSLRNLKGASFTRQPPIQLSWFPLKLKTSWREDQSFFDGSTKINNETMTLTLQKSGNEWKILAIE